jgi:stearoyl-CoA desaturase (Delta-9 desaturase)
MPSTEAPTRADGTKPMFGPERTAFEQGMLYVFILVPFLALAGAASVAWGWGLTWVNVGLAAGFYLLTGTAVTVGYHRLFTHGSFKAARPLRIALAVAGSMAMQGALTEWVADHRRHHAFSDRDGDPHSPWRYGTGALALSKGLWHSHVGWIFERGKTNPARFAPDLVADKDIRVVDGLIPLWMGLSLGLPALIGGLATWSWWGALTAFFWASLVRISLLHHVTWSINSICHVIGGRPFVSRDRAANFWPLAILSFGESWHNSHHADPTCARHGVRRGQWDISARMIRIFETLGWARDVRWPTQQRLARLAAR